MRGIAPTSSGLICSGRRAYEMKFITEITKAGRNGSKASGLQLKLQSQDMRDFLRVTVAKLI